MTANDATALAAERDARQQLKEALRNALDMKGVSWVLVEDGITDDIRRALKTIGNVYRTADGTALFFRFSDRRLYEITSKPDSPFGRLVTYLADLSTKMLKVLRCIDRIRADVSETAETVTVHAIAYNSDDASVIALNDFGGGMWFRRRGRRWEHKPNGSDGILFWLPISNVEPWAPVFDDTGDTSTLDWFLTQPHFADDVLTVKDQRLLLGALMLAPLFPARNKTRAVPVHLGGGKGRSYDTGKTMTGKMIGAIWAGSGFEPTPLRKTDRAEEDLQLTLMSQPYVLLDNVDTDIKWLNDFIATYATGARATKRKLYQDTEVVHIDYRGRLTITSRSPKFTREDVASRVIPLKFRPIEDHERKEEYELLRPILENRSRIWGALLTVAAKVQDALPLLTPPKLPGRMADFIHFGWIVAAVQGQGSAWEEMAPRLRMAQAGFVLDEEPLFPIIAALIAVEDLSEQRTSDFYQLVVAKARELNLDAPRDAASCTRRIKEIKELLEAKLEVRIILRTLTGYSYISIVKRASTGVQVGEVTDISPSLSEVGVDN